VELNYSIAKIIISMETMKILTIDGGGSKGVYSLGILYELEKKLGGSLYEKFDAFYGSSTGSIIAALLAKGKTVSEIKKLYLEHIPSIMRPWLPSTRTKRLTKFLENEFGQSKFDSFNKFIGIVATSLDSKAPLIFKSDIQGAHARKSSFEIGFGLTIKDAIASSCAAKPFFKTSSLKNNIKEFNLMDGGFSANNPTLFAIIDALKAFCIKKENLTVINIGTGKFPVAGIPIPFQGWFSAIPYLISGDFIATILDINTNTDSLITKLLLNDINLLRLDAEFSDPSLTTSILESDQKKLEKLFTQGVNTFGEMEKEFENVWAKTQLVSGL
jgi:patatin-like phospholipase/acyl hydrolase